MNNAPFKSVIGRIEINDQKFIVVTVDHTAHNFETPENSYIRFKTYIRRGDMLCEIDSSKFVSILNNKIVYEHIGTYKSLLDKEFFRQTLIERCFDLDENLYIIKELF